MPSPRQRKDSENYLLRRAAAARAGPVVGVAVCGTAERSPRPWSSGAPRFLGSNLRQRFQTNEDTTNWIIAALWLTEASKSPWALSLPLCDAHNSHVGITSQWRSLTVSDRKLEVTGVGEKERESERERESRMVYVQKRGGLLWKYQINHLNQSHQSLALEWFACSSDCPHSCCVHWLIRPRMDCIWFSRLRRYRINTEHL